MKPTDGELIKLGPWAQGINNLRDETAVGSGLREAVNVDIDDNGIVSRRDGYTKIIDELEPHSVFAYGRRVFYAVGTELTMFEVFDGGTEGVPTVLFDQLTWDAPLAHCLIEPNIYVSDGVTALRVLASGDVVPWSLPTAPAPQAMLAGAGSLEDGDYTFCLAYRAESGEEGPLSAPTTLSVTGGAVTLVFPAAPVGVARQLIYMTKPNGTAPLLYGSLVASSTMAVVSQNRLGRPPAAAGLDPMPAGNHAIYFAGRLLVASAEVLFWSEPNQYGCCALDYNYEMFAEDITGLGVAGETANGFFVGQATRTYFLRGGDPAEAVTEEAYPAGIVPGSLTHIPGSRLGLDNPPSVPLPAWLATNGVFCVGMPDGSVLPLTERRYAADVGVRAAATFVAREGRNQLLVTTQNPSENNFAFRDDVSFEVIRNGITL